MDINYLVYLDEDLNYYDWLEKTIRVQKRHIPT